MFSHRELFYKHLAQTSPTPLGFEITKAEGVYLFTTDGKKIIDFISGISVSNLGHSHKKVIEAVADQANKFMHLMVYGEFIQSPQVKFAEALCRLLPSSLSNVYFVNSGSEATEGALKLAKRYTGKRKLVCFKNAYHGSTHAALSVGGNEDLKNAFRPLLPEISVLEYNSVDQLTNIDNETAAVIVEPIQGEAGVLIPGKEFHLALRKRCDETGTLLIYDEIQTGFGRTGTLFAFEEFNISPDILLLGKALGGGMPIGAFIASKEIMSTLTHNPVLGHITTFGGHPVCCAAGLASLDVILAEKLAESALEKEKLIRKNLHHPIIKDVRGKGLFLAVEFETEKISKQVISSCIERGLLVDWFLFAPNCLRLAPPLIINEAQINEACNIILDSVQGIAN